MLGFRGWVVLVTLASASGFAAEHCVRAGAAGSGSGADWTNAYPQLPGTLVRGDTYYIADGDYAAATLNTAETPNNAVITIRKATIASHGPGAGWDDTFGDGQATFASIGIRTGSWTIDGAVGEGQGPAQYGFATRVASGAGDEVYVSISAFQTATFNNLVLRHLALSCTGPSKDTGQVGIESGTQSNVVGAVLQYVYVDNCQNSIRLRGSRWLIEHSYFDRAWSTPSHHGEQIDVFGCADSVFRFNVVAHCQGTTCIGNGEVARWDIYANVFSNIVTGNGVIGASGSDVIKDSRIFNNTIVDNQSTSFLYQNNPGGSGTGNIVRNNLFHTSNAGRPANGGGAIVSDHNAFFMSSNAGAGATDVTLSADPLIDRLTNWRLRNATGAGLPLAAPWDIDFDGVARGTDGTWDHGAFEYCAGGCSVSDGGTIVDAGINDGGGEDAGTTDGGSQVDAGAVDAGGTVDAGGSVDGGRANDAGTADAGSGLDAGSEPGGNALGGCGCSGSAGDLVLALALFLARRRSSGRRDIT